MSLLRHFVRLMTLRRKPRGCPGPSFQGTADRSTELGESPGVDAQKMQEETAHDQDALSCVSARCETCACGEVNHTAGEILRLLSETGRLSPDERHDLIDALIASVDIADLALGIGSDTVQQESPMRGLLLMRSKLLSLLARVGVVRSEGAGAPVDFENQEIALVTDSEDQDLDGRVASVIRAGYRTDQGIVRSALVRVYRHDVPPNMKGGSSNAQT